MRDVTTAAAGGLKTAAATAATDVWHLVTERLVAQVLGMCTSVLFTVLCEWARPPACVPRDSPVSHPQILAPVPAQLAAQVDQGLQRARYLHQAAGRFF